MKKQQPSMGSGVKRDLLLASLALWGWLVCFGTVAQAQTGVPREYQSELDELPRPVKGIDAFIYYMFEASSLAEEAKVSEVKGKVVIRFDVLEDGSVDNISVSKGEGTSFETEVRRLLINVAAFEPGRVRGDAVAVSMKLPVEVYYKEVAEGVSSPRMVISELEQDPQWLHVEAEFAEGVWKGIVYDKQGQPLPGVYLSVPDSEVATLTDEDGAFSIASGNAPIVQANYVGYRTTWLRGE
ncbi:MAG TPA: hypothetical protein DCE41_12565 [Cytophagales bacterium]|nr:hypothetical protein [Cytophagales bacterium]